jgi:hypothetical protein
LKKKVSPCHFYYICLFTLDSGAFLFKGVGVQETRNAGGGNSLASDRAGSQRDTGKKGRNGTTESKHFLFYFNKEKERENKPWASIFLPHKIAQSWHLKKRQCSFF